MSANIPAHPTSSSLVKTSEPELFYSSPPSLGSDNRRQAVDAGGFEALAGVGLPTPPSAAPQEQPIRPISELTFGVPAPPSAPDTTLPDAPPSANRTPVPDTTLYPWRANALLLITVPGHSNPFWATGWFIGPYAVITAGHAVYPRQPGGHTGWVSRIEVVPGLNGLSGSRPFGEAFSNNFQAPIAWQNKGEESQDYAVVLLHQGLGLTVGTYGYATFTSTDISSSLANLSGYPIASPDNTHPQGRQWYSTGNVSNVDNSFVYYNLGTVGGDSGSSLYRNIGDQAYAMAIHTGAANINRGVRITSPVYANLNKWASMQG